MQFPSWISYSLVAFVLLYKAECAITSWTKPIIASASGAGTLTEKINNGVASANATGIKIAATSGSSSTLNYTLKSQVPKSPALGISSKGVVTVTAGTVNYSSVASFTLVVAASDDAGTSASTATVTLLVNAPPLFSSYSRSPCIEDGAVAGTELITLSATDSNSGDTIKYAIASGNSKSDFKITTKGLVEVNTGKTLDMATTSSYTLVITATDNSSTPLVTSATVTATVSTTCSGAVVLAASFMTILSASVIINQSP